MKRKMTAFLAGLGATLNIFPSSKAPSYFDIFRFENLPSYSDPDTDAIAKDWKVIGIDMCNAIINYDHIELKKSSKT